MPEIEIEQYGISKGWLGRIQEAGGIEPQNIELINVECRRVEGRLRGALHLMEVVAIFWKKWLQVRGIWIDDFLLTIYYFGVD